VPARIVDGDALWRSDKLAAVNPPSYRAEYANLIPLAMADGTFECNPRRVWADVYSYNRPDITEEIVENILAEFDRVGLLKRSMRKGKEWGFWVGIESRLPVAAQSHGSRSAVAAQSQTVATVATSPLESTSSQSQNRSPMQPKNLGNLTNLGMVSATNATELFGQAKRVYRRYVGKSMGSLGPRESQWRDLVTQHGELVLSAVEIWAQEGGKGLRNVNWPLAMFLKNADEFIEAAKQVTEVQQAETKQEDVVAFSIQAGQEAHRLEEEELRRRRAEDEERNQRIAENPDALFQS
jgi:hypothetical protein